MIAARRRAGSAGRNLVAATTIARMAIANVRAMTADRAHAARKDDPVPTADRQSAAVLKGVVQDVAHPVRQCVVRAMMMMTTAAVREVRSSAGRASVGRVLDAGPDSDRRSSAACRADRRRLADPDLAAARRVRDGCPAWGDRLPGDPPRASGRAISKTASRRSSGGWANSNGRFASIAENGGPKVNGGPKATAVRKAVRPKHADPRAVRGRKLASPSGAPLKCAARKDGDLKGANLKLVPKVAGHKLAPLAVLLRVVPLPMDAVPRDEGLKAVALKSADRRPEVRKVAIPADSQAGPSAGLVLADSEASLADFPAGLSVDLPAVRAGGQSAMTIATTWILPSRAASPTCRSRRAGDCQC